MSKYFSLNPLLYNNNHYFNYNIYPFIYNLVYAGIVRRNISLMSENWRNGRVVRSMDFDVYSLILFPTQFK